MKKIIIANWKMNPSTLAEAKLLFNSAKKGVKNIKNIEVVICPPFLYISNLGPRTSKIKLGAQDCFWEESGPFTGEISLLMLKNFGCDYVIVGHSERRALGETDEMINRKLRAALKKKIKPILCIGETFKERKEGKTFRILKSQLIKDLKGFLKPKDQIVVAYEPVWAIGTGIPCQPRDAKEVLIWLKKFLPKNQTIYGGSVNSENAQNYIKIGFNGLLVGGASLKAKEFLDIVKRAAIC